MTEAAGARCAKARQGAQPWGSGGVPPHAEERPRRGPEAGGAVFIRPPWGGLILVSPAQRANNIASAMYSEYTACSGPPEAPGARTHARGFYGLRHHALQEAR